MGDVFEDPEAKEQKEIEERRQRVALIKAKQQQQAAFTGLFYVYVSSSIPAQLLV